MPPPPQPHASAGAGGQPSPTAKVPARYIIRNGLLIDRSASRQGDAKRIPISHRSDGPSPGGGARRLSPLHSPSDEQASSISVGSTHMAVERSAVVPTALPVSELPDEFHIYSAHREGRAFNLTSAAAALSGQPVGSPPPDGVPRYRIFPSMNPSSRQEAILLNDVLEKMLGRSNSSWEQQFHVYDLVLSEVVRQVWVNCSERGELLGKIRRAYARTVRAAAQRINQLEGAVRSLREELAMTDLAAAQRIAASQALTLDQQHEARKTALLTRMRAQYRHAMQGLHHGIDAFTRLSDGDRVRLMHVLACTKLERYQAAILVQALLETLPPAEATRAVRDYIDEVRARPRRDARLGTALSLTGSSRLRTARAQGARTLAFTRVRLVPVPPAHPPESRGSTGHAPRGDHARAARADRAERLLARRGQALPPAEAPPASADIAGSHADWRGASRRRPLGPAEGLAGAAGFPWGPRARAADPAAPRGGAGAVRGAHARYAREPGGGAPASACVRAREGSV